MKLHCEIVADLLPAYLDNTCTAQSRRAVEEHLAECEDCRELLEEMKNEPDETVEVPTLNEVEVMKMTSWVIGKRAVAAAAGVTAIVIYWLIFFWQDHLADWGDYRFFSYGFHEIWVGVGLMVVPAMTVIWLAVLLYRCGKQKTWRKNAVLLCALVVLTASQVAWFAWQGDLWSTATYGTVEFVDDEHILLKNGGEERVVLEVTPMVKGLLMENEVVYSVIYTHRFNDYDDCKLEYIAATDLPPDVLK